MSRSQRDIARLQQKIWNGLIPLEIRLASEECRTFDQSDPYILNVHRISYLPLLLPRLHAFFASYLIDPDVDPSKGWLDYEGVPLKWHYPIGLLYDLYSGAEPAKPVGEEGGVSLKSEDEGLDAETSLPWKLTIHFTGWPLEQLASLDAEGKCLHDAFINNVKEADVVRSRTGTPIMSMGKENSETLWDSVKAHDLPRYNSVNTKLLDPPGMHMRQVPIRLYLPHAPTTSEDDEATPGTFRVVQGPVPVQLSSRQPQTLGTALKQILPTVFQSARIPMLAEAVLHGAVVPLNANVEELVRSAAYADGWLHIVVAMLS